MSNTINTAAVISALFVRVDASLNTFGQCVVELRTIARKEGVDITDRKAVSAFLTPHVAAHYGHTELSRDTNTANTYRTRLTKAIVGDSAPQRVAAKIAVPRSLQAQVAQLLQQYDVATLREAIKRAVA